MAKTYYYLDDELLVILLGLTDASVEIKNEAISNYQGNYNDLEKASAYAFLEKFTIPKEKIREFWDFVEEREDQYLNKAEELEKQGRDLAIGLAVPELDQLDEQHKKELEERYTADEVFAQIYDVLQSAEYEDYIFENTNALNQGYYTGAEKRLSAADKEKVNTYLRKIDKQAKENIEQAYSNITDLGIMVYEFEQQQKNPSEAPVTENTAPENAVQSTQLAQPVRPAPQPDQPQPDSSPGRTRPVDSYP